MIDLSVAFPKANDCLEGHIGEPVLTIYSELADDRYYEKKLTRCGHCGLPLNEEDATAEDIARLIHE